MLYRKAESTVREWLGKEKDKVLMVCGARQIGKSYLIRYVGQQMFENFVEINLIGDAEGQRLFADVKTTDDFYFALGMYAGGSLNNASDTLVFLDEIQQYPHLMTMLKFLRQERRYRYVASGSLLGVTLKKTASIPIGSIHVLRMYPLDFEEFIIANGVDGEAIARMRGFFDSRQAIPQAMHERMLGLFKRYLLVGGMPDAVNAYIATRNIVRVREIQRDIRELYALDASQYDKEHRLKISRIYELVPSNLENKKKRLIYKDIEGKTGKRSDDYVEEIDYLISSGITLGVNAISNPTFPLVESEQKNLIKLYLNDVGLLTSILYSTNVSAVLNDQQSVNLGSVYECVVASELAAHDNRLFYYDNRSRGEVDYLIDDYQSLSVVPIEVKSGKDYKRHVALSRFVSTPEYAIQKAYVLSNSGEVSCEGKICYMPVYYSMFIGNEPVPREIIV